MKKILLIAIFVSLFIPMFYIQAANVCAGKTWKSCPTGKTFICLNNKPTCIKVSESDILKEESAPQLYVSGTIDMKIQQIVIFLNNLSKTVYDLKKTKTISSSNKSSSSNSSTNSEIELSQGENDGEVEWNIDKSAEDGYMLLWSKKSEPTYPKRSGDYNRYYSSPGARSGKIGTSGGTGTFYTRLCALNEDMDCGSYSNEIKVTAVNSEED
ncbi:MAG TPA: hypothetical protein PKL98_02785 [Candidatus Pacearchaeota archaeon]|nr:hypothetical protein [Candidatus Pacearchaeota archaeon]